MNAMRRFTMLFMLGLLSLDLATDLRAQTTKFRFERLSVAEGLSQNTVSVIYQDATGFMWFGTEDGLNKYDGYTFTTFKHNPDDSTSIWS